jgi:hypothetical protein
MSAELLYLLYILIYWAKILCDVYFVLKTDIRISVLCYPQALIFGRGTIKVQLVLDRSEYCYGYWIELYMCSMAGNLCCNNVYRSC